MNKIHIRDNIVRKDDIHTVFPMKPSKTRKSKPRRKPNITNSMSILSGNAKSSSIHADDSIYNKPRNRELFYKDNSVKHLILVEPRQLINENKQGSAAFIVEIVAISVAAVGVLILIAACLLYPKKRKQKFLEQSMSLYENNKDNSQASIKTPFEYGDNRAYYRPLYPKKSTVPLSTNSFPRQPAPVITHQKICSTDSVPTNSKNKRSDSYSQKVTDSVIIDTDNYTYSAMKLFSPFEPSGTPVLQNKTPVKTTKEQYRPSLSATIFTVNTPKIHNRESTIDPYSSRKTNSLADDEQNDSVFSEYQWTNQNGHVIPPKYHS